jgi:hypothetical protein
MSNPKPTELEPKPPKLLQNIKWILLYGWQHKVLLIIFFIVLLVIGGFGINFTFDFSKQKNVDIAQKQTVKENLFEDESKQQKKSVKSKSKKTLNDYFKSDFSNIFKINQPRFATIQNTKNKEKITIDFESQLYCNFDAQTVFLGFYIPSSPLTYELCIFLAQEYKNILVKLQTKSLEIESSYPGDKHSTELKNLNFSGRIFIYHESPLFSSKIEKLTALYKSNNLSPQFRDITYVHTRNNL